MKSLLLLEIGALEHGEYPVRLYHQTDDANWRATPIASGAVPETLADPTGTWDRTSIVGAAELHTQNDLISAGQYLFQLAAPGAVAAELRRLRQGDVELALAVDDPLLRTFPWELLYDGRFLALDQNAALYRHTSAVAPRTAADALPLRILVIVGERDDEIGWLDELEGIRGLERRHPDLFDVEELIVPTRPHLNEVYERFRPHVLHFIGHGVMNNNDAALQFKDDDGAWLWLGIEITADMHAAQWAAPLAFLNACRSAVRAEGLTSTFSLADAFIVAGSSCTLAMQSDVRGDMAAEFSKHLYIAVAEGRPLHEAVAAARIALNRRYTMVSGWAVPVLQTCCRPATALPRCPAVSLDVANYAVATFDGLSRFVDRTVERRSLCSDLSTTQGAPARRLYVVQAPNGLGKTFFLQWCAKHLALRSANVRYIDFDDRRPKKFLDVLLTIRRGDRPDLPIRGPLPDAPFAAFDERVADIASDVAVTEDTTRAAADLFKTALQTCSVEAPLLLLIDHLDWQDTNSSAVVPHQFPHVMRHLLEPASNGALGQTTIILALTDTQINTPEGGNIWRRAEQIHLRGWSIKEYDVLSRAALHDLYDRNKDIAGQLVALSKQMLGNDSLWSPSFLMRVRQSMEVLLQ